MEEDKNKSDKLRGKTPAEVHKYLLSNDIEEDFADVFLKDRVNGSNMLSLTEKDIADLLQNRSQGKIIYNLIAKFDDINIGVENTKPNVKTEAEKQEGQTFGTANRVLPITTQGLNWTGEPVEIGFFQSGPGIKSYDIPTLIPAGANMVRITAFQRSGHVKSPEREMMWKIWTQTNAGKVLDAHWIYSWKYPQQAISFQSHDIWLPLGDSRKVFVETSDYGHDNDKGIKFYVSAYQI